jgi:hypothetical protein
VDPGASQTHEQLTSQPVNKASWLTTELPVYPATTLNLKTRVHTRPVGERPFVELQLTDHPLAIEQRTGISLERVREIASVVRHADDDGSSDG